MQHIQLCIEEILAEIDAALGESAMAKALNQLDEREARGEALAAVDGRALRERLQKQLTATPYGAARAKLLEVQSLLAGEAAGTTDPAPQVGEAFRGAVQETPPMVAASGHAEPAQTVSPSVVAATQKSEAPSASVTRLEPRRVKSIAQRIAEATGTAAAIACLVVFTAFVPAPEVLARTSPISGLLAPLAELLSSSAQD